MKIKMEFNPDQMRTYVGNNENSPLPGAKKNYKKILIILSLGLAWVGFLAYFGIIRNNKNWGKTLFFAICAILDVNGLSFLFQGIINAIRQNSREKIKRIIIIILIGIILISISAQIHFYKNMVHYSIQYLLFVLALSAIYSLGNIQKIKNEN